MAAADHTYHQPPEDVGDSYVASGVSGTIPCATSEPKMRSYGKSYCVICSNCDGKVLADGRTVKMHRIPAAPDPSKSDKKSIARRQQRKVWIQIIKRARVEVNITSSTRICSEHFAGGVYSGSPEEVPVRLHLEKPQTSSTPRPTRGRKDPPADTVKPTDTVKDDIPDAESECVPTPVMPEKTNKSFRDIGVQVNILGVTLPTTRDAESQASVPVLGVHMIRNDDKKTRFYTGFKNWATFWLMFSTLVSRHGAEKLKYWEGEKRSLGNPNTRKYANPQLKKPGKRRSLALEDEFFMVWLRLRHDIRQTMLADLFSTSQSTVSRILNTWVNFLYDHLRGLIAWPTREQILSNLPRHFSSHQMVRIILDATEIFCEKPSSLRNQQVTWSEYKSHHTMKLVIGVTPDGMVNFISRLWGGRASDRRITEKDGNDLDTGFIPKLIPNDVVMADKGFTIADLLPPHAGLNIPPFVSTQCQMTEEDFFTTQQIASPRIVVEMKMEQLKNYRILSSTYELSEAAIAEQIVVICAACTNLLDPLLQ